MTDASLVVTDLQVEFSGFVAVGGVSFDAHPGEVRFLIGPNGAGKTTCIDAITGLSAATGSARLGEQELLGRPVHKIVRLGVGRTFQTASVFNELSVLQNLDIAGGLRRKAWGLPFVRRATPAYVEAALETIGLTDVRDKPAGILAHGQKQWLEIGMLLVQDAKVMFLDEPVAGMNADERDETGELLRRIGDERTIIVIEHDMDFVRNFAEWVTVMHAGKLLMAGTVEQVQADPRVQEVYLGTAADAAVEGEGGH
jgi:urea transport system ATP-binding protein